MRRTRILLAIIVLALLAIGGCQQLIGKERKQSDVVYEQPVDALSVQKRAGQSKDVAVSLERIDDLTMRFTIRMLEDRRLEPTTSIRYEVGGEQVDIPFNQLTANLEADVRTYVYETKIDLNLFSGETFPIVYILEEDLEEHVIPLEAVE